MARHWQLVIDCAHPGRLAEFWAEALGYRLQSPPDGFDDWPSFLTSIGIPESDFDSASALVDPDGVGPRIYFQRVPEGKIVKNRLHVDVPVSAGPGTAPSERAADQETERDRLVALGATEIGPVESQGERWIVMQDPEGNEFCIT